METLSSKAHDRKPQQPQRTLEDPHQRVEGGKVEIDI